VEENIKKGNQVVVDGDYPYGSFCHIGSRARDILVILTINSII